MLLLALARWTEASYLGDKDNWTLGQGHLGGLHRNLGYSLKEA